MLTSSTRRLLALPLRGPQWQWMLPLAGLAAESSWRERAHQPLHFDLRCWRLAQCGRQQIATTARLLLDDCELSPYDSGKDNIARRNRSISRLNSLATLRSPLIVAEQEVQGFEELLVVISFVFAVGG